MGQVRLGKWRRRDFTGRFTRRFIFDFVPDVLVTFYERKYAEAFRGGKWVGFDYECSSPEVFRLFHMAMYPIDNFSLLVVNSYLLNHCSPLLLKSQALPESPYLSPNGYLTMRANCRQTQRHEQAHIWDSVPRFLREPKRAISLGLCPKCVEYFRPNTRNGSINAYGKAAATY